jgi:hypothetical protein
MLHSIDLIRELLLRFPTLVAACCATSIVGCASLAPIEKQSPSEIAAKTSVSRDEFKKTTTLNGEKVSVGNFGLNCFWLSESKADSGRREWYLFFKTYRTANEGWAFWEEATDENGQSLDVIKVGGDVEDAGATDELIAVEMNPEYLRKYSKSGIKIRIDGKRASQVLMIPGNYIQGFLVSVQGFLTSEK